MPRRRGLRLQLRRGLGRRLDRGVQLVRYGLELLLRHLLALRGIDVAIGPMPRQIVIEVVQGVHLLENPLRRRVQPFTTVGLELSGGIRIPLLTYAAGRMNLIPTTPAYAAATSFAAT